MPRASAVVAALLILSSASVSHAQESGNDAQSRAAELTRQALSRYEAGEPEAAVRLLIEARALYREPLLLYNLARAYEALGRLDEALASYEHYVEERPDAPDRAAMEAHIESLRTQIAERERVAEERTAERRRLEAAEERANGADGPGAWPWLLIGGGGAALGAGIVLGVVAQSERDNAASDPVHETRLATFARAETMATAANILFVAGGVLSATGAVWLIVEAVSGDGDEGADGDGIDVAIGPGGVLLRGKF